MILERIVPKWPRTNYGRDKLFVVGCLCSDPRVALSQNGGMRLFQALR